MVRGPVGYAGQPRAAREDYMSEQPNPRSITSLN